MLQKERVKSYKNEEGVFYALLIAPLNNIHYLMSLSNQKAIRL